MGNTNIMLNKTLSRILTRSRHHAAAIDNISEIIVDVMPVVKEFMVATRNCSDEITEINPSQVILPNIEKMGNATEKKRNTTIEHGSIVLVENNFFIRLTLSNQR